MLRFNEIEIYMNMQPEKTRKYLLELENIILETVPDAERRINYNIPAYSLCKNGKRDQQIMIAGYKSHIGFYPHPDVIKNFEPELTEFKRSKGAVQFPLNKPLPAELIKKMIEYRLYILHNDSSSD